MAHAPGKTTLRGRRRPSTDRFVLGDERPIAEALEAVEGSRVDQPTRANAAAEAPSRNEGSHRDAPRPSAPTIRLIGFGGLVAVVAAVAIGARVVFGGGHDEHHGAQPTEKRGAVERVDSHASSPQPIRVSSKHAGERSQSTPDGDAHDVTGPDPELPPEARPTVPLEPSVPDSPAAAAQPPPVLAAPVAPSPAAGPSPAHVANASAAEVRQEFGP